MLNILIINILVLKRTPKKSQMAVKQKGEFCLDLKDDDDDRNGDIQIKLTTHQDLDELLNQPIGLPRHHTQFASEVGHQVSKSYPSNLSYMKMILF